MVPIETPLVSFVVPCFNYGRYLPDCLAGIFSQEGGHNYEVIAIDDGSTDNTPDVLRHFADARLRVLTHAVNQGHIATINAGLSAARGTFIARIDPDDRYRPYFLSTVLEKFARFPEVGLIYGNAALIDESGVITAQRSDRVHGGRDCKGNEFLRLLADNFICAPTVIARRQAWQAALPAPAGLAFNDWYFTLMIARQWEFYYIDRVLADYRVHAMNHHTQIVKNRSEEGSIFELLDRLYGQKEKDPKLERQKQKGRRRIYGVHYLAQANKYFGFHMDREASRCYLQAARHDPICLLHGENIRHWAATLIGRKGYEFLKSLARLRLRSTKRRCNNRG
ncbi:MAG: glycosyltransferase [Acidobacteria bacterium]|nr:glycosyltransferase [Acidobacteriota bacterium]MBI3656040.1 glycosyltransferase [Acidobacteriota bacterium]